jgi:outer membrane protein assembly factor BamB
MTKTIAKAFVALLVFPAIAAAAWPQWGGPGRNFVVDHGEKLAAKWPEDGPNKLWSRPLGEGYSSILADGDRLYTMHRRAEQDVVVALDAKTGKTVWEFAYDAPVTDKRQKLDFGKGPNATPLLADGRLYTVGFTAKLHCLDAKIGKEIWSHDLIAEFGGKVQEFGYSASPIRYRNTIIVLVGGDEGVMAFDEKSGKVAWRSEKLDISYASPIVIDVDGQEQLIFMGSVDVVSLDPASGRKYWSREHKNQYKNNCEMPVWGKDNILIVSSHAEGGSRALKLSLEGDQTKIEELWHDSKINFFHATVVRVGDFVYGPIGGEVTFYVGVNVKTGEVAWRQRGLHNANGVFADDKTILLDEDGKLTLAKVSPKKFHKLSQMQLLEKVAWTVPTLDGETLYVRDKKEIMALNVGASGG